MIGGQRSTALRGQGGATLVRLEPPVTPVAANEGEVLEKEEDGEEISSLVGRNLRRLRTRNGLSMDRLAKISGVSRAMLGQIELGRSAPTISLLWKIAQALNVPLSVFTTPCAGSETVIMRAHRAKWLVSHGGRFSSRALFPFDTPRREEFYELKLAPHSIEESEAHPPGTTENLVVARGQVEVVVNGEWHNLESGDSLYFIADQPHIYRNPGAVEATLYLVMVYSADNSGCCR